LGNRGERAGRLSRSVAVVVLAYVLVAFPARCELSAQSLHGVVSHAESGTLIAGAQVLAVRDGDTIQVVSAPDGSFHMQLPGKGTYQVAASSLGYVPSKPVAVVVEREWQGVELRVQLSAAPLEIEGLTVVARGLDIRHRATFGGYLARLETTLDVGMARVVSRDDAPMKAAFDIADVLRWFPSARSCVVVFVDGKLNPGWAQDFREVALDGVVGIEFYRNPLDAPLEFRGGGPPCLRTTSFSVLAVWREGGGV